MEPDIAEPDVVEPDKSCDAAELPLDVYQGCSCDGAPKDPGPGMFGCLRETVLYERVCMIDSSCNVYSADRDENDDPLKISTSRDDVAFRWEWAQPLPADARLVLNSPKPGDSSLLSPFTLFARMDPIADEFPFDFQEDSEDAAAGELVVSGDRMSVTVVPSRRCYSGHWFFQVNINLPLIYGGPVCGEPDNEQPGYTAYFTID